MDSIAKINDNKIGDQGYERGIELYFSSEKTRDSIENCIFHLLPKKQFILTNQMGFLFETWRF